MYRFNMKLLFELEIQTGHSTKAMLLVYDGVSPSKLVQDFVREHGLSEQAVNPLVRFVAQEIARRTGAVQASPARKENGDVEQRKKPKLTEQERQQVFERLYRDKRTEMFEKYTSKHPVVQQHYQLQHTPFTNRQDELSEVCEEDELAVVELSVQKEPQKRAALSPHKKVRDRQEAERQKLFEKLYQEAKQLKQKQLQKQYQAQQQQQPKAKKATQNDYVYNQSVLWRQRADEKIQEAKLKFAQQQIDRQNDEVRNCTFNPKISEKAHMLSLNNPFERLHKDSLQRQEKSQMLDKVMGEKDLQFSYRPQIDAKSRAMFEKMDITMGNITDRMRANNRDRSVVLFIDELQ